MESGGEFGIADSLGVDMTATILNSSIAGPVGLQAALQGVANALIDRPESLQSRVLNDQINIPSSSGFKVGGRELGAAQRWIVATLRSSRDESRDPIDAIEADMGDELYSRSAPGNAGVMSRYLAAIAIVGAAANFPDAPPSENRAAHELTQIA